MIAIEQATTEKDINIAPSYKLIEFAEMIVTAMNIHLKRK